MEEMNTPVARESLIKLYVVLKRHRHIDLKEANVLTKMGLEDLKYNRAPSSFIVDLLTVHGHAEEPIYNLRVIRKVFNRSIRSHIMKATDLFNLPVTKVIDGTPHKTVESTLRNYLTAPFVEPRRLLSSLCDLKDTSVEIRSFDEYKLARKIYTDAGAPVWPWHRGYKEIDPEEGTTHHTYSWEYMGFMKFSGLAESTEGTFTEVSDLEYTFNKLKRGLNVYI